MSTTVRLTAAFALTAILATACSSSAATNDGSTRADDGSVLEGGDVGAFRLQVGDCVADAESTTDVVESVPVVPCSEPHESQVYAAFDIAGDIYPGDTLVSAEAEQGCVDAFFDALGDRDDLAEWELSLIHPTPDTWDSLNDREVLCLAGKGQVTLTESIL